MSIRQIPTETIGKCRRYVSVTTLGLGSSTLTSLSLCSHLTGTAKSKALSLSEGAPDPPKAQRLLPDQHGRTLPLSSSVGMRALDASKVGPLSMWAVHCAEVPRRMKTASAFQPLARDVREI